MKFLSRAPSLRSPAFLRLSLCVRGGDTRADLATLFYVHHAPTNLFFSFHTRRPTLYMFPTDDRFQYDKRYYILICVPCGVVVMPDQGGGVSGHLEGSHKGNGRNFPLSAKERGDLFQLHAGRILNSSPRMPDPENPPIPHLPVWDEFYCLKCPYVCAALSTIRHHLWKEHKWLKKNGTGTLPSSLHHLPPILELLLKM
jgi:Orsellinic acid/F9775 biosynthesis cluster protein D